jgi:hypothetical protein
VSLALGLSLFALTIGGTLKLVYCNATSRDQVGSGVGPSILFFLGGILLFLMKLKATSPVCRCKSQRKVSYRATAECCRLARS